MDRDPSGSFHTAAPVCSLLVGVRPTFGPWALHNAHEAPVVDETLLGTPSQGLLLVCLLDLGRLVLHLTSTSQTSVHLTHDSCLRPRRSCVLGDPVVSVGEGTTHTA